MENLYKITDPTADIVASTYKKKLVRTRVAMVFFILTTVAMIIAYIVSDREYQYALDYFIEAKLDKEAELDTCKEEKAELEAKLDKVKSLQSVFIKDVEVGNVYYDYRQETDYGKKIYSSNTMYLRPRLKSFALKSGDYKFLVKLIRPDGTISTGTSTKSEADGYSYASTAYAYEGDGYVELSGWGNDEKGNWKAGKYKYEIWLDGKCLKTKEFTIY